MRVTRLKINRYINRILHHICFPLLALSNDATWRCLAQALQYVDILSIIPWLGIKLVQCLVEGKPVVIGERIALLGNDLPERTVDHRIIILRHWLAQPRYKALGLHGVERRIDPHYPCVRIDDSTSLVVNRLK